MKPKITDSSFTQIVLNNSFVQLLVLIILSLFVAGALLIVLSYFRPLSPAWLDDVVFNPTLLIFLLSPFAGSEAEVSLVIFDPTLLAIILFPVVYFGLFRPWIRRASERKKAEEIRTEQERIEYARKVKNEFLTNLSHELRTHLNSIIGFSKLLSQKTTGELNEKQKHYVSNILTSGEMQLALISDLLDLNRIETGKVELAVEKIHVPETIKETIAPLEEMVEKQNVLLKQELDPALEFIKADKHIFKQILFNLLRNAVKFSKESGGTVTITTNKEGDMAKISVSDTGIGIREEDMKRLFTQFPHIDSGTPRKSEGTGLGLALSKQLVEMHGGKIWAQSKFGEGSTFIFLLPLKTEMKGNSK